MSLVMTFYHNLMSPSGLGDRLLDVWAVKTIQVLFDIKAPLTIYWKPGKTFPGFIGTYDTNLFTLNNTSFTTKPYQHALDIDTLEHGQQLLDHVQGLLLPMIHNKYEIFLDSTYWGTTTPKHIHEHLHLYGLHRYDLAVITNVYRNVAKSLKPCSYINALLPTKDLNTCVAIHMRLTDKLVQHSNDYDMTQDEYVDIKQRCIDYVTKHKHEKYVVFSDDENAKHAMEKYLASIGCQIFSVKRIDKDNNGNINTIYEFFCLSQCKRIIQCTKYSTFSMAASLVNFKEIVNFSKSGAFKKWQHVLNTN